MSMKVIVLALCAILFAVTHAAHDGILAVGDAKFADPVTAKNMLSVDGGADFQGSLRNYGSIVFEDADTSNVVINDGPTTTDQLHAGTASLGGNVHFAGGNMAFEGSTIHGQNGALQGGNLLLIAVSDPISLVAKSITLDGDVHLRSDLVVFCGDVEIRLNAEITTGTLEFLTVDRTVDVTTLVARRWLEAGSVHFDLLKTGTLSSSDFTSNHGEFDVFHVFTLEGEDFMADRTSTGNLDVRELRADNVLGENFHSGGIDANVDIMIVGNNADFDTENIILGTSSAPLMITRPSALFEAGDTFIVGQNSGCARAGDLELVAGNTCGTHGSIHIDVGTGLQNGAIGIYGEDVGFGDSTLEGTLKTQHLVVGNSVTVQDTHFKRPESHYGSDTYLNSYLDEFNINADDVTFAGRKVYFSGKNSDVTSGSFSAPGSKVKFAGDLSGGSLQAQEMVVDGSLDAGFANLESGDVVLTNDHDVSVVAEDLGTLTGNVIIHAGDGHSLDSNKVSGGNVVLDAADSFSFGTTSIAGDASAPIVSALVVEANAVEFAAGQDTDVHAMGTAITLNGGSIDLDAGSSLSDKNGAVHVKGDSTFGTAIVESPLYVEGDTTVADLSVDGNAYLGDDVTIQQSDSVFQIGNVPEISIHGQNGGNGKGGDLEVHGGQSLNFGGHVTLHGGSKGGSAGLDAATITSVSIDTGNADGSTEINGDLQASTVTITGKTTGSDLEASTLTTGQAYVDGMLSVSDTTTAASLKVKGRGTIEGGDVAGHYSVGRDLDVAGDASVGPMDVSENNAWFGSSASVSGPSTFGGTLDVNDLEVESLIIDESGAIDGAVTASSLTVGKDGAAADVSFSSLQADDVYTKHLHAETVDADQSVNARTINVQTANIDSLTVNKDAVIAETLNTNSAVAEDSVTASQTFTAGSLLDTHDLYVKKNAMFESATSGNLQAHEADVELNANADSVHAKELYTSQLEGKNVAFDNFHTGNLLAEDVLAKGALNAECDATFSENATINCPGYFADDLEVVGGAWFAGNVAVGNDVEVATDISVGNDFTAAGYLAAGGAVTGEDFKGYGSLWTGDLSVGGSASFASLIGSDANLGDLTVDQETVLSGSITANTFSAADDSVVGELCATDANDDSLTVGMNIVTGDDVTIGGTSLTLGAPDKDFDVYRGSSEGSGKHLNIYGSQGENNGGSILIRSGAGGSGGGSAGDVTFNAGSTKHGNGGEVDILAGTGNSVDGGVVRIHGGDSLSDDNDEDEGGSVLMRASKEGGIYIGTCGADEVELSGDDINFNGNLKVDGDSDTQGITVDNTAWFGGDVDVSGSTTVDRDLTSGDVNTDSFESGDITFGHNLVASEVTIDGHTNLAHGFDALTANVTGPAYVGDNLKVEHYAKVGADLDVAGDSYLKDDLYVHESANFEENLHVRGSTFLEDLDVTEHFAIRHANRGEDDPARIDRSLIVDGDLEVSHNLNTNILEIDNAFNVNHNMDTNSLNGGDTTVGHDLVVGGLTSLNSATGEHNFFGYGNLNSRGNTNTDEDVEIARDLNIGSAFSIAAGLEVAENARSDSLTAGATKAHDFDVANDLTVTTDIATNDAHVGGTFTTDVLDVTSHLLGGSDLSVDNELRVDGRLFVGEDITASSADIGADAYVEHQLSGESATLAQLKVGGDTDVTGSVQAQDLTVAGSGNIDGSTTVTGDFKSGSVSAVDASGASFHIADLTFVDGPVDAAGAMFESTLYVKETVHADSLVTEERYVVGKDVSVDNAASVAGRSTLHDLSVQGDSNVDGTLDANGDVYLGGATSIANDLSVGQNLHGNSLTLASTLNTGTLNVRENAAVSGTLDVEKHAHFGCDGLSVCGAISVEKDTNIDDDLTVGRNLDIGDDLTVDGDSNLEGLDVTGALNTHDLEIGDVLDVDGGAKIGGDLDVDNRLTVGMDAEFEGKIETGDVAVNNTLVDGDLFVSGNAEFEDVHVVGNLDVALDSSLNSVDVGRQLHVRGSSSFDEEVTANNLYVNENINVGTDVNVGSHLTVGGDLLVIDALADTLNTDGLVVDGEAALQELQVSRQADFFADVDVLGTACVQESVSVGVDATTTQFNITGDLYVAGSTYVDNVLTVDGTTEGHDFTSTGVLTGADATFDDNVGVSQGTTTIGGVQTKTTLSTGSMSVGNDVHVYGGAEFERDVNVGGDLTVEKNFQSYLPSTFGNSTVRDLKVGGTAHFDDLDAGDAKVHEDLHSVGSVTVSGDAEIKGTETSNAVDTANSFTAAELRVAGDLSGNQLTVDGETHAGELLSDTLNVNFATSIADDMLVDTTLSIGNDLTVYGSSNIANDLTATVTSVSHDFTGIGSIALQSAKVKHTQSSDSANADSMTVGNSMATGSLNADDLTASGDFHSHNNVEVTGAISVRKHAAGQDLTAETSIFVGNDMTVMGSSNVAGNVNGRDLKAKSGVVNGATTANKVDVGGDTWADDLSVDEFSTGGYLKADSIMSTNTDVSGDLMAGSGDAGATHALGGLYARNAIVDGDVETDSLKVGGTSSVSEAIANNVWAENLDSNTLLSNSIDSDGHLRTNTTTTQSFASSSLHSGDFEIGNDLTVDGKTTFDCDSAVEVCGPITAVDTYTRDLTVFNGSATVNNDLAVKGSSSFEASLNANEGTSGATTVTGHVQGGASHFGGHVQSGTLDSSNGAWFDHEMNVNSLNLTGDLNTADVHVDHETRVGGDLETVDLDVSADVSVSSLDVTSSVHVNNDLIIHDLGTFNDLSLHGNANANIFNVSQNLYIGGDVDTVGTETSSTLTTGSIKTDTLEADTITFNGTLTVLGHTSLTGATVQGNLGLDKDLVSGTVNITRDSSTGRDYTVTGDTTVEDQVVNHDAIGTTQNTQGSYYVSGNANIAGTEQSDSVHTGKFKIDDTLEAGNATFAGPFYVGGDASLPDTNAAGPIVVDDNANTNTLDIATDAWIKHEMTVGPDAASLGDVVAESGSATGLDTDMLVVYGESAVAGNATSDDSHIRKLKVHNVLDVDGTVDASTAHLGSLDARNAHVHSLAVHGDAFVNAGDFLVDKSLGVHGNVTIDDSASLADVGADNVWIGQDATINTDLSVHGASMIMGSEESDSFSTGALTADSVSADHTTIGGYLKVEDDGNFNTNLTVAGPLTVDKDADIGTLDVVYDALFDRDVQSTTATLGALKVEHDLSSMNATVQNLHGAQNMHVNDDLNVQGAIHTHSLNVFNELHTGLLYVEEDSFIKQTLTVSGTAEFLSSVDIEDNLVVDNGIAVAWDMRVGGNMVAGNAVLGDVHAATTSVSDNATAEFEFVGSSLNALVLNTEDTHTGHFTSETASIGGSVHIEGGLSSYGPTHVGGDLSVGNSIAFREDGVVNGTEAKHLESGHTTVSGPAEAWALHNSGDAWFGADLNTTSTTAQEIDVENADFEGNLHGHSLSAENGCVDELNVGENLMATNLEVGGTTAVEETIHALRDLVANDSLTINDNLDVTGYGRSSGSLTVDSYAKVAGSLSLSGHLDAWTGLTVLGSLDTENLTVAIANFGQLRAADTTFGAATVGANAYLGGDLLVQGTSDFYGSLSVLDCNDISVEGSTNVHQNVLVGGWAQLFGSFEVGESVLVGGNAKILANAIVGGNIDVTGETDFEDNVAIGGDFILVEQRWCVDRYNPTGYVYSAASIDSYDYYYNKQHDFKDARGLKWDVEDHLQEDSCKKFLPNLDVTGAATFGGSIYVRENLQICGDLDVAMGAWIFGDLNVVDDAYLQEVTVDGDTQINGFLSVSQNLFIYDELEVHGFVTVDDDFAVEQSVFVGGEICVIDNATLADDVFTDGNVYVGESSTIDGDVIVDIDMNIGGDASTTDIFSEVLQGCANLDVGNDLSTVDLFGSNVTVSGSTFANSATIEDLEADGNGYVRDFEVQDDAHIREHLSVSNTSSFSDNLDVSGNAEVGSSDSSFTSVNGSFYAENDFSSNSFTFGGLANITGNVNVERSSHFINLLVDDVSAGNLTVHGWTSVSDNFDTDGDFETDSNLYAGNDLSVGGWVRVDGWASFDSLSAGGDGTFNGDVETVWASFGDTQVNMDLSVMNDFNVGTDVPGHSSLQSELLVEESATFDDLSVKLSVSIGDGITVGLDATFEDDVWVKGDISTQNFVGHSDFYTMGDLWINGMVPTTIGSDTYVGNNLNVDDSSLLETDLLVEEHVAISNLTVGGNTSVGGNLMGGDFTVGSHTNVNGDTAISGSLQSAGNTVVGGDLEVSGDAQITGTLEVEEHVSLKSDVFAEDTGIGGYLSIDEAATITGQMNVTDDAYFGDELTVAEDVEVCGDLAVQQSVSIGLELEVYEHLSLKDSLWVGGDIDVDEYLTIDCELTAGHLNISGDAYVSMGDLSVTGTTNIDGDLSIKGDLSVANLTGDLGKIDGDLDSLTIGVEGDVEFQGDLTVEGTTMVNNIELNGAVRVSCGPLSFSYPGASDIIGATPYEWRDPMPLTSCCTDYLVVFADENDPALTYYNIELTGGTLNILMPGKTVSHVYRMETLTANYRYEVGDWILLRGSPDLNKHVEIVDYQQAVAPVSQQGSGNIYNGRSLTSLQMGEYYRMLDSDEIFVYMYSPRVNIGGGNFQDATIAWTRLGVDFYDIS